MAKLILILFFTISLFGDIFKSNCLSCHTNQNELKLFMSKYTLKYSSKKAIKKALFRFLRNPTSNRSIMPYSYIIKYGFKEDSNLSDKQLKRAVDIYYEKYNLQRLIK